MENNIKVHLPNIDTPNVLKQLGRFKFLIGVVVLAILAISIPLTLNQVKKFQESRSHAAAGEVSIKLTPYGEPFHVGDRVSLVATVEDQNPNYDISAIDITIDYDKNLLEPMPICATPESGPPPTTPVEGCPAGQIVTQEVFDTNGLGFTTIVKNINKDTGTVHYVGVNPTSQIRNGGVGKAVTFGGLNFKAKAPGSATVGFSNIHINAAGVTGALPIDTTNTKIGTYTISTGAQTIREYMKGNSGKHIVTFKCDSNCNGLTGQSIPLAIIQDTADMLKGYYDNDTTKTVRLFNAPGLDGNESTFSLATGSDVASTIILTGSAKLSDGTLHGDARTSSGQILEWEMDSSTGTTSPDLRGNYRLAGTCVTGCTGDFIHIMKITAMDGEVFSGTGYYIADPSITWTVTGTVNPATKVVLFHIVYTGTTAGYSSEFTGTLKSDGSMSGTNTSSQNQTGTWILTPLKSLKGLYNLDATCTINCTGDYIHTVNITDENIDTGTFSGKGIYNGDTSVTWDITGTENWVNKTMTFHLNYTGTGAGYKADGTGKIRDDGTMDGTDTTSQNQTANWKMTPIKPTHCGGNTANPLTCQAGQVCIPVPGQNAPAGDVGGICVVSEQPQSCTDDSSCPAGYTCNVVAVAGAVPGTNGTGGVNSSELKQCVLTGGTSLSLSLKLPGVGNGAASLQLNANPKRLERGVTIVLSNSQNQQLESVTGKLLYDRTSGLYKGIINLGKTIQTGAYLIKVSVDNSLRKSLPGIQNITVDTINQSSTIEFLQGDIVASDGTAQQDNVIDVADYTTFLACYRKATSCTAEIKSRADFTDDGVVDDKDLNILYTAFKARQGD